MEILKSLKRTIMLLLVAPYYFAFGNVESKDGVVGLMAYIVLLAVSERYGHCTHVGYLAWALLVYLVSRNSCVGDPEQAFSASVARVKVAALCAVLFAPVSLFFSWLLFLDSGRGQEFEWQDAVAIVFLFVLNLSALLNGWPCAFFGVEAVFAIGAAFVVWLGIQHEEMSNEAMVY